MHQNKNDTQFKAIQLLRENLIDQRYLQILHPDAIWQAEFFWNEKATVQQIQSLEQHFKTKLPSDYVYFLTNISNGAVLYADAKYGQWGYKLYSTQELIPKQAEWMDLFSENWRSDFIIIGQFIDELHLIVLVRKNEGYILFEGNPLDSYTDWEKMANSLQEWIDGLVIAQGAKYWDWCE